MTSSLPTAHRPFYALLLTSPMCKTGECSHDNDGGLSGDCPSTHVWICAGCTEDAGNFVPWPCDTIRATTTAVDWCRACGCTEDDCRACVDATGQPCGWADADHTLCTRCADATAATITAPEATP